MRSKKIARIKAVQEQLHKRAEIDLHNLELSRQRLIDEQRSTIMALNDDQNFQGLFVDVMSKRLKILAVAAHDVATRQEEQKALVMERGLQVKRTEKLERRVVLQEKSENEKTTLSEITDLMAGRIMQVSRGAA